MNRLKRVKFNCIYELAEIMTMYVDDEENDNYPIISAYCKFDVAKELIETLVRMSNSIGCILELNDNDVSGYDKEFVVYLTKDGVTCEPTYREDSYYHGGGDISYVHEDCNSKLLDYIESDVVFEFGFSDEDSCEPKCGYGCCGNCDCDEEDFELPIESDGDMHGFSVNKSDDCGNYYYSFYSTDKDLVSEMARLFRR